jgi:hypothetical protein
MKAFFKSVLAGASAGAALTTLLLMWIPSGAPNPLFATLMLGLVSLLVTIGVVLAAALTIGLPLSALLQSANRESCAAYIFVGAVSGFLIPILFTGLGNIGRVLMTPLLLDNPQGGWWISSFVGAVSGAVTGTVWWKLRSKSQVC